MNPIKRRNSLLLNAIILGILVFIAVVSSQEATPLSEFEGQPNRIERIDDQHMRVHTEIVIDASPEEVWTVLTDFDSLATWSSTLLNLEGDFSKDSLVTVLYRTAFGDLPIEHALVHFEEGRLFGWSDPFEYGGSQVLDNHKYIVEPFGEKQTLFIQSDEFKGESVRADDDALSRLILGSYVEFNQLLKEQVESMK